MSINLKGSDNVNFEPMTGGLFPARLYQVIHIGTVEVEWKGEKKLQDKVRLGFEFPTETKVFNEEKGEQPNALSREFTLSISEKGNLRPFLEGWQGKKMTDEEAINVDLEEWVGKTGMINVVHGEPTESGQVYANITTISPLPKNLECPDAVNEPFIMNYNDKWDIDKFESLPEFIKSRMKGSSEYDMITREKAKPSPTSESNGKLTAEKAPSDEINLMDIPF